MKFTGAWFSLLAAAAAHAGTSPREAFGLFSTENDVMVPGVTGTVEYFYLTGGGSVLNSIHEFRELASSSGLSSSWNLPLDFPGGGVTATADSYFDPCLADSIPCDTPAVRAEVIADLTLPAEDTASGAAVYYVSFGRFFDATELFTHDLGGFTFDIASGS